MNDKESKIPKEKKTALDWVDKNQKMLADFNDLIWRYNETPLREYGCAKAFFDVLTKHGFHVEEGIAGMPTAFVASYGSASPTIGTFCEYDGNPEQSQRPVPYPDPISTYGPGYGTAGPHCALGTGALAGVLAAKNSMEQNDIKGKITIFGTPAEKACVGKPYQAAQGYYDGFDAFVNWHPAHHNTLIWETAAGSYWNFLFTFEPELDDRNAPKWGARVKHHAEGPGTRHPGALDAIVLMYTITKFTKEHMLPRVGGWNISEYVMIGGQATADNQPPAITQIQYAFRSPSLEAQETIKSILENNAKSAALATGCKVTIRPITKTRVGLPNLAMAELGWRNLQLVGPPKYDEKEREYAREVQKNLKMKPTKDPFDDESQTLLAPWEAEKLLRKNLAPSVKNYGSDDYVEFTWHAPTLRLRVAMGTLRNVIPPYPNWARRCFDATSVTHKSVYVSGKVLACSIIELLTTPSELEKAKKEFNERTGGGICGTKWVPPLLPKDLQPPIELVWPEWVDNRYPTELNIEKRKWHIPY